MLIVTAATSGKVNEPVVQCHLNLLLLYKFLSVCLFPASLGPHLAWTETLSA